MVTVALSAHDIESMVAAADTAELRELPAIVHELLAAFSAPPRLVAHLYLVHDVAASTLDEIQTSFPGIAIDAEAMLFGAATHDIGKALHPDELDAPGKEHELAGEARLLEWPLPPRLARFARTHGLSVDSPELGVEDLLVITADKVWKGKRVAQLEERLASILAELGELEFWSCWQALDGLLEAMAQGADERLSWQQQFPARA